MDGYVGQVEHRLPAAARESSGTMPARIEPDAAQQLGDRATQGADDGVDPRPQGAHAAILARPATGPRGPTRVAAP